MDHENSNTDVGKQGANGLHRPQFVDLDHHTSNGEAVSAVVVNGGSDAGGSAILHTPPNSSHGAELGQLQAQVRFAV